MEEKGYRICIYSQKENRESIFGYKKKIIIKRKKEREKRQKLYVKKKKKLTFNTVEERKES